MGRVKDLTGQRFGRLTVTKSLAVNGRGYSMCECDCGNVVTVRNDSLKKGSTKSCGCITKEIAKTGTNRRKHGFCGTRLHRIWGAMKTRCNNPHSKRYEDYGGRGIIVCDEWLNSFEAFYEWAITNGYSENLSIDRIDVNGNYEPSNCRWATAKEQNSNKRSLKLKDATNE